MLVTNLATFCCGMASHSSIRICRKSANVVLLVTLLQLDQANHKCWIGLRSGLTAGHSILSIPKFWRCSMMILALWRRVLEDSIRSQILAEPMLRWKAHTCDWHTSASTWSPEREWIPAEQYYRPFWRHFGWCSPHICLLCCSFHDCLIHTILYSTSL